jgi:DNA-binding MarR family transcriptional regulator
MGVNTKMKNEISLKKGGGMVALVYKFLDFANEKEKIHAKYGIDEKKCKILRVVTQAHLENIPIKVRDLIDMSQIASPATIHKAMKSLIVQKLLKLNEDSSDKRIKYLVPTPLALKMYKEVAKQM